MTTNTNNLRSAWNGYAFARRGMPAGHGMAVVSEQDAFATLNTAVHAVLDAEDQAPTHYTVVGIWYGDEPIVAGVIAGEHGMRDSASGGDCEPFRGRWAVSFETDDPNEAEARAVEEMDATLRPDEEEGECPNGTDDPEECALIRERSAAGKSETIPDCPVHGEHPSP